MSHNYLNEVADLCATSSYLVCIDDSPSQLQLTLLCIRRHGHKCPVWVVLHNVSHRLPLLDGC
jgi:hypothetical protein